MARHAVLSASTFAAIQAGTAEPGADIGMIGVGLKGALPHGTRGITHPFLLDRIGERTPRQGIGGIGLQQPARPVLSLLVTFEHPCRTQQPLIGGEMARQPHQYDTRQGSRFFWLSWPAGVFPSPGSNAPVPALSRSYSELVAPIQLSLGQRIMRVVTDAVQHFDPTEQRAWIVRFSPGAGPKGSLGSGSTSVQHAEGAQNGM